MKRNVVTKVKNFYRCNGMLTGNRRKKYQASVISVPDK